MSDTSLADTDANKIEEASTSYARPVYAWYLVFIVTLAYSLAVVDRVSIRGIVSTRDAESTFAYVVDGVLNTNPNAFNEELVDIQQIEVLKGPQGALYGRNAVAGAILVTTKQPGEEFEGKVRVSVGNIGAKKYSASLSGPLTDNVGASLTVAHREQDGFFTNIFTGEDDAVDYLEDDTLRGRLVWDATDALSYDLKLGYSKVSAGAINFNAAFAIPAFVDIFGSPTFNQNVNDMDFRYTFNVPGENEQETRDISLKMDYAMDAGDLTANITYNDLDEYLLSDGTSATFYGYELTDQCQEDRATLNSFTRDDLFGPAFQPFGVLPPGDGNDFTGVYGPYTPTSCDGYQYQERNQSDISAEVRFTSPQDQDLRWLAGAYATQIDREVVIAYGADQGQGFLRQPYVDPTGPNPTDLLFWDDFDTDVFAVFGQLEYDLTDTLELAFALRYDREKRTANNKVPNVSASGLNVNTLDDAFQPGPINPGLVDNPDGIPSRSSTFSQVQPKVTLSWAASDNINLYSSYGIGFRSGGFNSLGSSDLLDFWFNAGAGGPGETVDAQLIIEDEYDKEVSASIELGMKSNLLDNRLSLNAAVFQTTVDDNQFFEFFAGPFGLLRVVTTVEEIDIQGLEIDFNWAASDYISIFGGAGFLDSEIKENQNRPLSDFTNSQRDAYDTLNLRVGIESEAWSATAWGKNITDEEYLEEMLDQLGLADELLEKGLKAPVYHFRERQTGEVIELDLSELSDHTKFPYRLQCEQHVMASTLAEKLQSHPKAEVRFGHRVTAFKQTDDGVEVALENSREIVEIKARYLIAADGGGSIVRKWLKAEFEGFTYPEKFLTLSTKLELRDYIDNLAYVSYVSDPEEWLVLLRVPSVWRILVPASEDQPDEHLLSDEYKNQPDFDALSVPGVTNHYSRIIVEDAAAISDETFMAGTLEISENTLEAVRGVMTCQPDHLVMGMSAVTFYGGAAGGMKWKENVEDAAGIKLTMGSESLVEALKAYGNIKKVAFLSPYFPVANKQVAQYLSDHDIETVRDYCFRCPSWTAISQVTERQLIDALKQLDGDDVDALVQVGTNLSMVRVAAAAELWLDKPVIAINTATYWNALRQNGIEDKVYGYGQLLERH
eukprot:g4327.t1